ncbi:uncharacterized protein LAJ45_07453 [Morchella importuna]|uniref:PH domain-like protein n=1 Tax=Morchella conica CCBAS932 TaxID=1392247 RepID=A0A3N4L5L2_9PEZI|nr:uncharacterized protein LAJ45_07453 [Morchella importuna]KAH8148352.1 hypothetical protein LAJ45_07453 [Morchella importuna]RPB15921.1 PH domain-like protein [Morchella conica CCBAS932]
MSTAQVLSPIPPPGTAPINAFSQREQPPQLRMRTNTAPIAGVDQDGAFHMDKVIKSGWLMKRNRKTKNWKRRWFVLRGDRLQSYKDQKEYKIHRQVYLNELTAVAVLKDAKKPNVFGLFSPSRNYHFQGESLKDTNEWVECIRSTAALADADDDLYLGSPINAHDPTNPFSSPIAPMSPDMRLGSSSPEFGTNSGAVKIRGMGRGGISSQTLEYSGAEVGSFSSMSDGARISQLSLGAGIDSGAETEPPHPGMVRNESGFSTDVMDGGGRVVWHGYLYCLKSKGGVRQWKKYWVVLRTINLAFYKTEEEYRAIKIIPLDSIVDAVEIDPVSKSKKHCMQVITEGKSFRFSAPNEEVLAKWLGAMKSTLSKRAIANTAGPLTGVTSPVIPPVPPMPAVGSPVVGSPQQ